MGFSFRKLLSAVLLQSVLLVLIAIPMGILLAFGMAIVIHTTAPVYLIALFEPVSFMRTLIASVGFGLFGAVVPLRAVYRSDPMLAFQGA